jgi:hypothetical protein
VPNKLQNNKNTEGRLGAVVDKIHFLRSLQVSAIPIYLGTLSLERVQISYFSILCMPMSIRRNVWCYIYIYTPVLGGFVKLRIATISFVVSLRPHGTTRLPLDGFL